MGKISSYPVNGDHPWVDPLEMEVPCGASVEHESVEPPPGLSADSVRILLALVDSVNVSMAHPDAAEVAAGFARARRELESIGA